MAEKNVQARIQHKHDTEANWNKATGFIPKAGELIIYDKDENHNYLRVKIGDGSTLVSDLEFVVDTSPDLLATTEYVDQSISSIDNAVLYTEQTLTDEQKAQARTNINAVSIEEVEELLGIEEEFSETGNPLILNLEKETELEVVSKISRQEGQYYYDLTKLTLHQIGNENIIDVASMFGGAGTVIEKNGLTMTINDDGTATVKGTSTASTLFDATIPNPKVVYPAGSYNVPTKRMCMSGFDLDDNGIGNKWGKATYTIDRSFVLYRIFIEYGAGKTVDETIPINITLADVASEIEGSNVKAEYTVDFGKAVTEGEYNWTTGELKDADGNTVLYYAKQQIVGVEGMNIFWTGFGEVTASNKSDGDLEKVVIRLGESAPAETVASICDFTLTPTTPDVSYCLHSEKVIPGGTSEFYGHEIPLITTKGTVAIVDAQGEVITEKYVDALINWQGASDLLTNKGIHKEWSEKFYFTKEPISQEDFSYSNGQTNSLYTFEFTEDDFKNTGLPAKLDHIPIVSPCFYTGANAINKLNGRIWGDGIFPATFSWDDSSSKYIFKVRGLNAGLIKHQLQGFTKGYFHYQLETSYDEPATFAMGISSGDAVIFIVDNSDWKPYLDGRLYKDSVTEDVITEVDATPTGFIYIPRNAEDACDGMINTARMLNNAGSAGGDATVQGYSWIGEGDGVSDYTIQIQQKIDEIYKVSKGGTINLGPGTYKINNSLIIYENTIIQGNGHTIIEQTADNTHAVILSGSNISLRDLTIKLSGACTEETACIFANSDNHPTLGGHWDETYPQNMYVQFCSAINVTLIGTYSMSSANGYYYLSDEAKAYRGYGFKGYGLYFNYFTCVNLTGRHLFSVVGGSSGSRISVTATECRYGVYPGIANSVIEITGHSYYGNGENGTMINASESLVRTSSCYSIYLARSYDSQHYDIVIFFDEQSMGNTCIPNIEMSNFSNTPEYHSVSQALNKSFINYGRANSIPGYQETHPFFVGNRYQNLIGQTLINPQLHGSVDNALAGAGVWGEITSNITWNEDYLSLSEICRYPQDAKNFNSHDAGMPTLLSTISPSEENPIEIIIDITKRPIMTFQNLWIQFNHDYVASDFSIQTADGNGNWRNDISYFVNNREPIFYYMMHQNGSEFQINKIRIIITKAQVIPGLTGMRSDHVAIIKDYNPEGLIGICNVGMTHGDAFGRAFLGECGGSLYGNVDMHQNTLKNLPTPVDDGDAVSKAYVDALTQNLTDADIDELLALIQ